MSAITIEQTHKNSKIMFRKQYQVQFGQIFKALLEIPNDNLRKQITEVINKFDSNTVPKSFVSQETQTSENSVVNGNLQCLCATRSTQTLVAGNDLVKNEGDPQNIYTKSIIRQLDRATQTTSSDLIENKPSVRSSTEKQSSKIISGKEVKLGRAKRVNVPHVKNDQASINGSRLARIISPPKAATKKYQKITPKVVQGKNSEIPASPTPSDPADVDEILNNNLDFTRILQSDTVQIPRVSNEQMQNDIQQNIENCLIMDEEGFLPIHRAVQETDELVISQQCYILNLLYKTIEFITDENSETPLHLAIKNESSIEIVQLLLKYNSNILSKNDDGNNALHLCILHCTDVEILKLLLSKITIDKLGTFNYDGMSILHLTILENKFLFAKTIIDHIDRELNISPFITCDSEQLLYSKLQDYICSFTSDEKPRIDFNVRKMEILNQKNMKSGRTPLFLAVSLINENISFLLMAHGCDPRIEDFSGTDCNELSNHVIGNKLISTAVYNATYYLDSAEAEQTRKRYEASKLKLMKKEDTAPSTTKSRGNSNGSVSTRGSKRTYPSASITKKMPIKMRLIEKS